MAKKARRTTHRSSTGTKLYAVRDARGCRQAQRNGWGRSGHVH